MKTLKFDTKINALICGNKGCTKLCSYSSILKSGRYVYRPYCSHCHDAGRGLHPYREGVTPVKKNICENSDGRLDFKCYSKGRKMPSHMLDLDHINGDHHDNRLKNFQTLCKCCHAHKTKMSGDASTPYKYK
jgi:hypothetical protein